MDKIEIIQIAVLATLVALLCLIGIAVNIFY